MHPGDLDHEDMNRITSSMIFDHYVISNVLLFSTFSVVSLRWSIP